MNLLETEKFWIQNYAATIKRKSAKTQELGQHMNNTQRSCRLINPPTLFIPSPPPIL